MFIIGKNKEGKDISLVTKVGIKVSGDPVKQKEIGKNFEALLKMGRIVEVEEKKEEVKEPEKVEPVKEEIKEPEKKDKPKGKNKKEDKKIVIGAVKKEEKKEIKIEKKIDESEADRVSKEVYDKENK